ncbi:MAG: methyltransferase domain-containing protein, partial [Candidatus Binatia bacterium]
YYRGILDILRNQSANYILVSYERAVAEPKRFATEVAELLGLPLDQPAIQLATQQITGDGGGYLPASRHFHIVEVLPPNPLADKSLECPALTRGRDNLKNLRIDFQDKDIPLTQDYIVRFAGGNKQVITIIFDFGDGFTGLACYDLPLAGEGTLIRLRHKGAVRRIGFGSRGSQLPCSVTILRCPGDASTTSAIQRGVPAMIFSSDSGFREDSGLGYHAAGLNRMNSRFRVFMEPLKEEIAGSRVLDLASHDGRWSYAALKLGASDVTGIEARPELIEKGKHLFADAEFKGHYDFIAGDIFDVMPDLRKQGQTFDVVLCLGIFYHVMDHFRLMRLIRDFGPRLVILDTGLIDDEKPYISLGIERNDSFLKAIASSEHEKASVVGVVSKGGLKMICRALNFDIEFLNWNSSDFPNHAGLRDYFPAGRNGRRRFSAVLRNTAKAPANGRRLVIPAAYPWQGVSTIVSERDRMLAKGKEGHYLSVGVSAFQNIAAALKAVEIDEVSTILDLPCGHGRVARVLRAAFPAAEFSVSDLDPDGMAFCAEQFGASPLALSPSFATLNFGKTFDLIWVGSLITHLPERATRDFIAFALRHLNPKGVAVLSSHGALVPDRITGKKATYGVESGAACRMIDDYQRHGYGYADYPRMDGSAQHYGISIATRDWITSAITGAGGKVLYYKDGAWDNHHDIVAFMRGS